MLMPALRPQDSMPGECCLRALPGVEPSLGVPKICSHNLFLVQVWVVSTAAGDWRVLILNKDPAGGAGLVRIDLPSAAIPKQAGVAAAQVVRLTAPSIAALSGATFGGRAADPWALPSPPSTMAQPPETVTGSELTTLQSGTNYTQFEVQLQSVGAVMLTLAAAAAPLAAPPTGVTAEPPGPTSVPSAAGVTVAPPAAAPLRQAQAPTPAPSALQQKSQAASDKNRTFWFTVLRMAVPFLSLILFHF